MKPKLTPYLFRGVAAFIVALLPLAILLRVASTQSTPPQKLDPGFHAGAEGLTPSQRAGREIWFKATAGNDRFHTYVFQQRLGVLIDWNRVLGFQRPRRTIQDVGNHQRSRLLHTR